MNTLIKRLFLGFSILGALSITFVTTSCGHKKWPREASQLDSISNLLPPLVDKLSSFDSTETKTAYDTIMANLKYIQDNLKDSISREDAEMLSDYRGIRKPLKNFSKKRQKLLADYAINSRQISTLSVDLKKGLIEENKAYQYFVIEFTAANENYTKMKDLEESTTSVLQKYQLNKPKVDLFIANMKTPENLPATKPKK